MLTYAAVQIRFPHTCPGRHCQVCKWEQQKATQATAAQNLSTSAKARRLSHQSEL